MFADRENIETRRVGKFCGLEDFLKPLLGADRLAACAFGIRSPNV